MINMKRGKMNKISLIIPIYNSEKNLNTLLNNLVKQDYDDYEIIIIDDGSFDQGRKIVEEFQKKNNRIKYYYQENMGPGLARKNGFIKSTGKLIFFIDSDDYLPNTDVLKKINELYERYYFEILFFNYQLNSFVVVELKAKEYHPKDIGQLKFYVDYIDKNIKLSTHNKTIGLLIVKKKNKYVIEYVTNEDIYVTTYELVV